MSIFHISAKKLYNYGAMGEIWGRYWGDGEMGEAVWTLKLTLNK
jgi:hypothetical protein